MRKAPFAVLVLVLLLLTACGADSHVSGIVTDTNVWNTFYPCGKTTCITVHHSFVVGGHDYQDDWDDVRTGDHVSFDYNDVWGVSNLTDSTVHHDDYTWLVVALVVVVLGGAVWYGWQKWREA